MGGWQRFASRFAALFLALLLFFLPSITHAQTRGGYYSTSTASGTENSAVALKAAGTGSDVVNLAGACNYDTGNPKVAMLFDSAALPSNGVVPIAIVPLAAAAAAAQPTCASFSTPIPFRFGIVIACSTTGKTLTVDTTSGGNCYFEVSR